MKKLLLLTATLITGAISGQLSFTTAPQPLCHTTPTTYIYAGVVSSPSATGFSWSFPGAPSGQMFVSWGAGNGHSVAIANTAGPGSYTITCTSYLGTVTTGSSSQIIQILPSPTVNASANPAAMLCPGGAHTLSASGAATYTWAPGNVTGSSYVVNPVVNTCYTVTGVSSGGCIDQAVVCVNVYPYTPITISASSDTVCKGSSVTHTVTSGVSYTWSTGGNAQVETFIPANTGFHTANVLDTNGCVSTMTAWVTVDTTCADVWPGDANSDGTVDGSDVLELGLNFSSTGSSRTPGGNTYISQFANTWVGNVSTGKNRCHADCDGNGTVNANDTMAIYLNWNQNHSFKSQESSAGPALSFSGPSIMEFGTWGRVDIMLGSASDPVADLYGVTFDITFPTNMIVPDSVYILYTPSFMSADGANLHFRKYDMAGGVVHAARVRTNGSDLSGNGKIAELHFKVKNTGGTLVFKATNGQKINDAGTPETVASADYSTSAVAVSGFSELSMGGLNLAPNPASDRVTFTASSKGVVSFRVSDLAGRIVRAGTFSGSVTLDISGLAAGTYAVSLENGASAATRKLVVIH